MTRMMINGGDIDFLCECGHPKLTTEPLNYGWRLIVRCRECNVRLSLDVIE